jgi:hypothetical protein
MNRTIYVSLSLNSSSSLYLTLVPLFNLLTKLTTSSSYFEMSLLLLCSFYFFFPFFFDLLDDFKDDSFISVFYCSVLISYDVKIPCTSSMLIEFIYTLSFSVDILGSNHIGRVLRTF